MSKVSDRSVYKSRIAALRVNVLKGRTIRHPVTGDITDRIPAVVAEFGITGPEYQMQNQLTGEMDTFAQIIGGFYDLDAVADDKIRNGEWTPEIKAAVKRRLDEMAQQRPDLVQKVDYVTPPAPKPWPTYDTIEDEKRIVELAAELGAIEPSIAYERENRDRPKLIEALQARAGIQPDPEPEPEPVVALEQKPKVEAAGGRVVV